MSTSTEPRPARSGTATLAPAATAAPVYDRGDTVCVIGAGASGLAAIKNLREHGFGVDCYERETGVGGGLELAARPQPGLRQHPPDLVQAVHPVPRLPDAGLVAGLSAPQPGAGLPRAVRRPLRAARAHLVRHRGDPGGAGRRTAAGTSPSAAPAAAAPTAPALRRRGGGQRAQLVAEAARVRGAGGVPGRGDPRLGVQGRGPAARQAGAGRRGRQHRLRHRGRGGPAGGPLLALHPPRLLVRPEVRPTAARPTRSTTRAGAAAAAAAAPVAVPPRRCG